jgi:hypothetical protein
MCEAARLLRAGPVDGVSSNAYLESMLLHARALAEFLVLSRSRPSDIRRQDFADEWSPTPVEAVARLTDHVPTLDRHLSHLTWERVETGPPSWEYHQVADDVLMIAFAWLDHLNKRDSTMGSVLRFYLLTAHNALTAS